MLLRPIYMAEVDGMDIMATSQGVIIRRDIAIANRSQNTGMYPDVP